jgi:hypothetical protein
MAETTHTHTHPRTHGWLDSLAIGMAGVCAVHCLLMPLLIVLLPIIATSFFVHQDFHLWMLLLVIPTTSFAIFMGCRKHREKWIVALSAVGLAVLSADLAHERSVHAAYAAEHAGHDHAAHVHGPSCIHNVAENPVNAWAWINTFGGLFLAGAHVRNYRLCRKTDCRHD